SFEWRSVSSSKETYNGWRMPSRGPRPDTRHASALFLLVVFCALACERDRWEASASYRAPDTDVAAALGDSAHDNQTTRPADELPVIHYPRALRPCCVFGEDVKVELGRVLVPGVEIHNILGLGDVGPHRYDNGYISIESSDPRGFVDSENNG